MCAAGVYVGGVNVCWLCAGGVNVCWWCVSVWVV